MQANDVNVVSSCLNKVDGEVHLADHLTLYLTKSALKVFEKLLESGDTPPSAIFSSFKQLDKFSASFGDAFLLLK